MDLVSGLRSLDCKLINHAELVDIDGISLIANTADRWDEIRGFKARPDDLVICSYPKAGTTWMQEIVDMIQHGGDPQICARAPIYERNPFIELCPPKPIRTGFEEAELMPSPRTLKSHLPVHLLPPSFWEQNCKIIYIARNVKDTIVSYFYFHKMHKMMPDPGTWDEFLEKFITGKVAWGSWFDHVQCWWKTKNHHPILYIFYEDIKEDPAREIQKVAQFLGHRLPEPVLNRTLKHVDFESMKVNPMVNYSTLPSRIINQDAAPFMRKGIVGDWKNHFTVAQSERLDDVCTQLFRGSNLTFRTQL
uniref:Sulfotransferase n=1 Tax=Salvator merianae TaxID=96440 RepID=A0A8D0DR10_SALMN